MTITIRPVSDKAGKRAFLDVAFDIYRDDPQWIAPLYIERFEHLDPKKNPYFKHAEVQLFVAERDGRAVGRISAQLCALRSERYQDGVGQFGFLEAPDDAQVFEALVDAAAGWLKQRGCTSMQGPFSFSINDESGVLIDGFDTSPNMMMGHARPYYRARLEEQGFVKAKDLIAYISDGRKPAPRPLRAALERAKAASKITIRPVNKKNLARDLDIIVDIFNDAWSENWGFVPFTRDEITALGNNLKTLVKDDYGAIAEYKGQPAAMAVSLPNINEWIRGLDGRLLPFGWAKVAWNLMARPPRSIRLPLVGLKRAHHGTIIGAALVVGAIDRVRNYHVARGTEEAELSWILEDNLPMRRVIEEFGGDPYKTYRVYERPIA